MTLFFIDSRQEIKVGVGMNFPVCPLGLSEIQIHRDVATELDVDVDDIVSFKIFLDSWLPGFDAATLFSLMTLEADFVAVDHETNALVFENGVVIPFNDFWGDKSSSKNENERVFDYTFRVK